MTSPVRRLTTLRPGQPAPGFALDGTGGRMSLDAHRGHRIVLLVFLARDYMGVNSMPADFYSAAGITLLALGDAAPGFSDAGVAVAGILREPIPRLDILSAAHRVPFPLLSDETGHVGRQYGVLPDSLAAALSDSYDIGCAAFLVDREGMVQRRHTPDLIVSDDARLPVDVPLDLPSSLRRWKGTPTVMRTGALLNAAAALGGGSAQAR